MGLEKIPTFAIENYDKVKITEMGNVTELLYMSFKNDIPRIQKLDKDHYIVLGADGSPVGDVKEFVHWETRAASANSLRKTFRSLRNIINANVVNVDRVRFITLTYRQDDGEPMTDTDRLYLDFKNFNKRLKRYCEREGAGKFEYINTVEPQGSGAWHCHVLYFWNGPAPYLKNDVVREMWGQGFVTVRALKNHLGKDCDNVGAYLTAYLGDLDVESALEARMDITQYETKTVDIEEAGEKHKKYYLKGARLYLYPPGMSIYRCSRGIKRPKESECTYLDAKRKVRDATLTFQSNLRINLDGKSNTLSKRYYNTAVEKCQAIEAGCRVDKSTGEVLEMLERFKPELVSDDLRAAAMYQLRTGFYEFTEEDPNFPF